MTSERTPYRTSQAPGALGARRCLSCGDMIAMTGHCVRCGTEATVSDVRGSDLAAPCPRCNEPLRPITYAGCAVLRCDGCAGVLVTPADWGELLSDPSAERAVLAQMVPPPPGKSLGEGDLRRLIRCPVCRLEMDRYRFASLTDIAVDACNTHGIWFDAKELARVLQRIHARDEAALSGKRAPEDESAEREWEAHLANIERSAIEARRARGYDPMPREGDLGTVMVVLVNSLIRR
ncbi:hypothetical protein BH09MYX1_BH09MYX1_23750 [soil metagenome]